jgi:hypothetical protein
MICSVPRPLLTEDLDAVSARATWTKAGQELERDRQGFDDDDASRK